MQDHDNRGASAPAHLSEDNGEGPEEDRRKSANPTRRPESFDILTKIARDPRRERHSLAVPPTSPISLTCFGDGLSAAGRLRINAAQMTARPHPYSHHRGNHVS
ncbi:hypothetical protein JJJ17_08915 [Paracoccus caeni]|uniref:Uncharacterized protein n=1 Tax=Paracoccus caeni TaxID=657651 RepID=A0A934W0R5_9RHOB|nr:hypothetical protein [Paracoccus caeni]MBK4216044.1 hypothetical protein [Paracoccus caeni]